MQAPSPPLPIPSGPPKTSGLAIASLVCGCLGFILAFLTGIPAIITGHKALGKIKRSGGTLGGSGIATTGLVLGYVTTGFTVVWLALAALATPAIFKALERANMAENISNVRQIKLAADMYAMDHDGQYPPKVQLLEDTGYIHSLDELRYKDAKDKTRHDWLYTAGHANTDNPTIILFAGPMTESDGKKRIVCFLDSSSKPLPESDYQRQLRSQRTPESPSGP